MAKTTTSTIPLILRPGTQYRCFGDGLCCSDIHVLGPLGKDELIQIRRADRAGAVHDDTAEDWVIRTAPDGGCHFQLSDQRCSIHATAGPEAKPAFCQRFPVGLVETPEGGRVTTHHRCPCRTVGARPDLDKKTAREILGDANGEPWADRRVKKVRLHRRDKKVDFKAWRAVEKPMLKRLAAGESPERVLDAMAFPPLKDASWEEVADEFAGSIDGSAFGFAIATFAEVVRGLLHEEHRVRLPVRPWADAFARAAKREDAPRTADAVLADWLADEIWALAWSDYTSFDLARSEWATRIAVARSLISILVAQRGLREDHAAAEALMVVELVGDSEFWTDTVVLMRPGKGKRLLK